MDFQASNLPAMTIEKTFLNASSSNMYINVRVLQLHVVVKKRMTFLSISDTYTPDTSMMVHGLLRETSAAWRDHTCDLFHDQI